MTSNGRIRTGSKDILVLKLSPDLLRRFPNSSSDVKNNPSPTSNPTQPSDVNMDTAGANTPIKDKEGSPALSLAADQLMPPSDNASDAASTPAGGASGDTPRRKGLPGPKPGSKRSLNPSDSVPKPRAKPGPKKRQKLLVYPSIP